MIITKEEMQKTFEGILKAHGLTEDTARETASIFVANSIDGVYSHGVNRFPRFISYIDKGYVDPKATPTVTARIGALERWNGNLGIGVLNAKKAMARAITLAQEMGIGCIALGNTNHWMRGGAYGWMAADAGMIGILWTNTMPNMPPWGAKDNHIGNNPFVMAVPRSNGQHVVVDTAMALYSYGKLETTRLQGKMLPFPGGFDEEGNLSSDPAVIEATRRVLPIGYWKGSGMAIAFDLIAAMLSGGKTSVDIGKNCKDEYGLSQVMIAIDPAHFDTREHLDALVERTLEDLKSAIPVTKGGVITYPGEQTYQRRMENEKNGIPVNDSVWEKILQL